MSGKIYCAQDRCSLGKQECDLWSECPMFVSGISKSIKKPGRANPLRPTEESEQQAVVEFCKLLGIKVIHIPNEGKRSVITGARLKAMGLQKGFPDLFVPEAKQGYHGLFIELKRDKTNHPTKEQLEWISYLNAKGYYAVVCYGSAAAIAEIRKYMGV